MRVAASLVAALCLGAAPPSASTVDTLAWMSGTWETGGPERWTEESWSKPRGGIMMGTSRTAKDGKVTQFEFMRLAPDANGVVTYWASPGGRAAVGFRLVESGPSSATFENPEHDFPVRISYRRSGTSMTAVISGIGGANPQTWQYRRRAD